MLNIQEIKINKFPAVIFSDSHTNLSNIKKLKELYPDSQLICLGDFTFLFAKPGEQFNNHSIQYFIDNKIPALLGNHESYIVGVERGNSFVFGKILGDTPEYDLTIQHLNFLEKLPIGFKLILPNGNNYYCFHNEPKDLWGHTCEIPTDIFRKTFLFDNKTVAVIQGHLHRNLRTDYVLKPEYLPISRVAIGQLCNSNHHTGENNGGNYLLLTENGLEYKRL